MKLPANWKELAGIISEARRTEKNPYTLKNKKTKGGQLVIDTDALLKVLENFKGLPLIIDGLGRSIKVIGIYEGEINDNEPICVIEVKEE